MDFICQIKNFSGEIGAPGIHNKPTFSRNSDIRLLKLKLLYEKKVYNTEISKILCKLIRFLQKVVSFTVKSQFLTYRTQEAYILHITKHHKE